MMLCSACCQTGVDMYLFVYIFGSDKYNMIPASIEELKAFLALWEKVRMSHDYISLGVLKDTLYLIQYLKDSMGKIDFHPKDSRKGYMEGRLDREFSYPKDDSCIRFVEHLDFLKKIVGIES